MSLAAGFVIANDDVETRAGHANKTSAEVLEWLQALPHWAPGELNALAEEAAGKGQLSDACDRALEATFREAPPSAISSHPIAPSSTPDDVSAVSTWDTTFATCLKAELLRVLKSAVFV